MVRKLDLGSEFIQLNKEEYSFDEWNFICNILNIDPIYTLEIRINPDSNIQVYER